LRGWQYPRFPPIELLLGRVDLHHSPASYITPALGARGVISVFDLFFLRHPEHRDPFGGTYFARTFPRGLERMDRVITCSRFTRDELIKIYEVSPERIAVVPLGVDRDFFDDEPRPTDRSLLDPWTEGRPYLLCVGAIGPRKNLIGLLEAYAEARRGLADPPLLLMVGRVHDDRSREELDEALDRLALRPWVRFTGYAPAEHLPVLYRHARALVIPSFNEGFGLPVLEAMACGCPVLAAKRGSLPEVAGEAAIMLDIASTSRVAEALARISRDEDLRDRFREAGLERVKSYSWRSSARATIEVYRDLLEETGFWKAEAIREAGRSTAAR
jgi:alpha-1,3-rhamnosyl/mannosyltransferase